VLVSAIAAKADAIAFGDESIGAIRFLRVFYTA
jgi:hypothetical protein